MSLRAEILTTVCAVGCALGIGYMMQNGDVAELRYGSNGHGMLTDAVYVGEPVATDVHPPQPLSTTDNDLAIEHIELTSGRISTAGFAGGVGSDAVASVQEPYADVDPYSAQGVLDCEMSAQTTALAGALVELTLTAPCHTNARVTIEHEGLAFSDTMPPEGVLVRTIPVLKADAEIVALFATGGKIVSHNHVPNLKFYDRVVMQSAGADGIEMHAREIGANYGDDGHVWSGAGRSATVLSEERGGFLTALGDASLPDALTAQVYTFPADVNSIYQSVNLTIETEVTDKNCANDVVARVTQIAGGKKTSEQALTLAVPDCDAIGQFLVLNNLLQDLTLANK